MDWKGGWDRGAISAAWYFKMFRDFPRENTMNYPVCNVALTIADRARIDHA
jgi:hypothetical protein